MTKDTLYNPQTIEKKWQKIWEKVGLNKTDLKGAKKPFYNLMMYPYPSAEGLHVGNVYAFTGADIYGRFKRMQGWDVFEPIGFDSGGIHSENYAIQVGVHPKIQVPKNITHFKKQLHQIGCMYDWDHTVDAMDPEYYKWTQWIFIQLFKAGLAYKKKAPVIWCPSCKTTLSDEQTEEKAGVRVCERCKTEVTKKELEQWFFRITKYAERLLENTEKLDWTEKVLIAQRNWIGKSEGINIDYEIVGHKEKVTCFTTRPDTNFGATFIVLAPEHPLIAKITSKDNKKTVSNYIRQALKKTEIERIADVTDKTGVFTGTYAINNLNGKKMPIWVSDFVLYNVGTGAVVGVPGHDIRDFDFAKKFGLPIVRVVVGSDGNRSPITKREQVHEEEGTMINSRFLDGMDIHKATREIMDYLEEKGWGKKTTTYKLRDWCISRQRYWGPPIPMIFCKRCGWQPVPEKDLPVLLPDTDDYLPGEAGGKSPLARLPEFVKTTCPKCGGEAQRETDVSDTFLDSSWYFLRYPSVGSKSSKFQTPSNKQIPHSKHQNSNSLEIEICDLELPWNLEITRRWLPVDQYTGGAEHSVLHLLYSRFITMALHDLGYLDFSRSKAGLKDEPFPHFYAHGLIIKDGAKMSKSRGNIVNPDEYIAKFGTDALRCYLMFLGPFNQGGDFRDTGMIGMYKFLAKIYRFCQKQLTTYKLSARARVEGLQLTTNGYSSKEEAYWVNKTIKKIGEDIGKFKYNTAIAAIMEYVNYLTQISNLPGRPGRLGRWQAGWQAGKSQISPSIKALKTLILVLAPFAPHLTEELWSHFAKALRDKQKPSVHQQPWPKYDPKSIKEEQIVIVIQINGKVRDRLLVNPVIANFSSRSDKEKVLELAKNSPKIQTYLKSQKPKKTIFVPGKLINFVV